MAVKIEPTLRCQEEERDFLVVFCIFYAFLNYFYPFSLKISKKKQNKFKIIQTKFNLFNLKIQHFSKLNLIKYNLKIKNIEIGSQYLAQIEIHYNR